MLFFVRTPSRVPGGTGDVTCFTADRTALRVDGTALGAECCVVLGADAPLVAALGACLNGALGLLLHNGLGVQNIGLAGLWLWTV